MLHKCCTYPSLLPEYIILALGLHVTLNIRPVNIDMTRKSLNKIQAIN